MQKNFKSKQF